MRDLQCVQQTKFASLARFVMAAMVWAFRNWVPAKANRSYRLILLMRTFTAN